MNTIASIIVDHEIDHAVQQAKIMRAAYDAVFAPAKPPVTIRQQIQELTSREAQLEAQLNDVRERLTLLNARFPGAE